MRMPRINVHQHHSHTFVDKHYVIIELCAFGNTNYSRKYCMSKQNRNFLTFEVNYLKWSFWKE